MGYRLNRRRRGWLGRLLEPYNTYTVPHEQHPVLPHVVVRRGQPWWVPCR